MTQRIGQDNEFRWKADIERRLAILEKNHLSVQGISTGNIDSIDDVVAALAGLNAELGENPQGSSTDVATRFQTIEDDIDAIDVAGVRSATGAFIARKSIPQNLTGTPAIITYNNTVEDVSDWYDAASSSFTPKIAGYYYLSASIYSDPFAADNYLGVDIIKNGTLYARSQFHSSSASYGLSARVETISHADGIGDNFHVEGFGGPGTPSLNSVTGAQNTFMGFFIGA